VYNVFRKDSDGTIRHFWGSEMLYAPEEPGQHHRAGDLVDPVWGRHISPPRMTWTMPLITRRSSTRGTPRGLFGKSVDPDHDGYRDADDNLALLIGTAQALEAASGNVRIDVGGLIYGDVKDGGQYYMLNPAGDAPASFGTDNRYGDIPGNRKAAGNYAFFKQYAEAAIDDLDPALTTWDLLASDRGGMRAWNFDATKRSQITSASAALVDAIVAAIKVGAGKSGGASEFVVNSAGGRCERAAEAIGFLLNKGYSRADIVQHFAVVQHGNWAKSYEAEARELTRDVTIAISDQNVATYANGRDGPDLKHAMASAKIGLGSGLGSDYAEALAVATGANSFRGLAAGTTFPNTKDASDAGSHAFVTSLNDLLSNWANRLGNGEIDTADKFGHRILDPDGNRSRVMWNYFDAVDVAALLKSSKIKGVAIVQTPIDSAPHFSLAATTRDNGDLETLSSAKGGDLGYGAKLSGVGAAGAVTSGNPVRIMTSDFTLEADSEIETAPLRFTFETSAPLEGGPSIEFREGQTTRFATLRLAARHNVDENITCDVSVWNRDQVYRTPDLSDLVRRPVDYEVCPYVLAVGIDGTDSHSTYSPDLSGAAEI
jgi:hypothetical protein